MGIKILRLRHRYAPEVGSCRWCGISRQEHGRRWLPSKGWHAFEEPTDAQRKARLLVRRLERERPRLYMPPLMAQWGRTANADRTRL